MDLFGIINDRRVNFSKTANGWSLTIYTKDKPPTHTGSPRSSETKKKQNPLRMSTVGIVHIISIG